MVILTQKDHKGKKWGFNWNINLHQSLTAGGGGCPAESWPWYYRAGQAVHTPFFVGNNTLLTSEDTLMSDEDGQWQLTWRVCLISDSRPGLTSLRDSSVWYPTPDRTDESPGVRIQSKKDMWSPTMDFLDKSSLWYKEFQPCNSIRPCTLSHNSH